MKETLPKRKEVSSEGHLKTEAANFVQVQLMKRFLERDHGHKISHEEKVRRELVWAQKYAPVFRTLFTENIDAFLDIYQKDRGALVETIENILDDQMK